MSPGLLFYGRAQCYAPERFRKMRRRDVDHHDRSRLTTSALRAQARTELIEISFDLEAEMIGAPLEVRFVPGAFAGPLAAYDMPPPMKSPASLCMQKPVGSAAVHGHGSRRPATWPPAPP